MTDPQIFAFLVTPFLFVLTSSMVFYSHERSKPEEPVDPPEPVTRPSAYTRKPRKRSPSSTQADATED
ncbi:hypothetical protein BB934_31250 (plasmid) [Microvirga ossetica]|uniref:Uncharacterized protein n=1 Tax=Microvirga ossetica TaxID=1882682 RepID=A0A1B2ERX4_9HYPH|nr:hypothetical protein [Microvirga ossetica]ANY82733.1 hypothetical protein BB934_31250 [Microvirga ossetica]